MRATPYVVSHFTAHDLAEMRRMARALDANGHALSAATVRVALDGVTTATSIAPSTFDLLMDAYRNWLVFNTTPVFPPSFRL